MGSAYLGNMDLKVHGFTEIYPMYYPTHGTYSVGVTEECHPYAEFFIGESDAWGRNRKCILLRTAIKSSDLLYWLTKFIAY